MKMTSKLIKDHFYRTIIKLIKDKDIEHISVMDICESSELSRTTFYRYFKDKNDVISFMFDELVRKEVFKDQLDDFYKQTLIALEIIQDNKKLFKKLFNYQGQNSFIEYYMSGIDEYLEEKFEIYYDRKLNYKERLKIEFITAGIANIAKNWVDRSCSENPEFITEVIIESLSKEAKEVVGIDK